MDLRRDFAEQNMLVFTRLPNFGQKRRLRVLYHKFWMEMQLLCFEFPPRKPNNEEAGQLIKLGNSIRFGQPVKYQTGLDLTGHSELLDEYQMAFEQTRTVFHLRTVKCTLLMKIVYLRHVLSGNHAEGRVMVDPVRIRDQQTAICSIMYKAIQDKRDDGVSNGRILAIADIIRYVDHTPEDDKYCTICYENFRSVPPVLRDNNIRRGSFLAQLDVYKILCFGELPAGTHCLAKLPCGHKFGAQCIWTWMLEHHQCPLCRYDYAASLRKYDQYAPVDREPGNAGRYYFVVAEAFDYFNISDQAVPAPFAY